MKKIFLVVMCLATALTCVVSAVADSGTVKIDMIPDVTHIDMATGSASVTYSIRVTPPENGHIGAIQFDLQAPEGVTLPQGEDGWTVNTAELRYIQGMADGCFGTVSYTPASGIFLAAGTTAERNLDEVTEVMTITMTIDDISKVGTYAPIVTAAVASEWDVANTHAIQVRSKAVKVAEASQNPGGDPIGDTEQTPPFEVDEEMEVVQFNTPAPRPDADQPHHAVEETQPPVDDNLVVDPTVNAPVSADSADEKEQRAAPVGLIVGGVGVVAIAAWIIVKRRHRSA